MIIQKIKDVIRGKDILQNSKKLSKQKDLKIQHNRKLIVLKQKIDFLGESNDNLQSYF